MSDLLRYHCRRRGYVDLARPARPFSVQAQMCRAQTTVELAWHHNRIPRAGAGSAALVIGAGPGGMTAAMTAARLGFRVIVVDSSQKAFSLLDGVRHRELSPTLYDFPSPWWRRDRYPLYDDVIVPLPWKTGRADEVQSLWKTAHAEWPTELAKLAAANPALRGQVEFAPATTADVGGIKAGDDGRWRVAMSHANAPFSASFDLVVIATGLGTDARGLTAKGKDVPLPLRGRPRAVVMSGPGFWENDDLAEDNLGLDRAVAPRLLILGGGDGALQDLQRAMLRRDYHSPRAALDQIGLPEEHQVGLSMAAAQAVGHEWAVGFSRGDCWRRVNEACSAVEAWARRPEARDRILPMLRAPRPHVTLVHVEAAWSESYAVNRVLVAAVRGALDADGSTDLRVLMRSKLARVAAKPRLAAEIASAPLRCRGHAFEADFDTPAGPLTGQAFNLLSVRFGADKTGKKRPRSPRGRDHLPLCPPP